LIEKKRLTHLKKKKKKKKKKIFVLSIDQSIWIVRK